MRMALLAIVLLLPLSAAASPFGIQLGSTIEDLRTQGLTLHPQRPAYEYALEFPGEQPEGTAYVLLTPELGVCEMRWVIPVSPVTPSGAELQRAYLGLYERIIEALDEEPKYRNPLQQGAKEADLWKSLYSTGTVEAAWEKSGVTSMRLEARSDQPGNGAVQLTLSAPWIGDCLQQQKAKQQDAK